MKASELIKELEWFIENFGDEDVVVYAKRYGDWDQYPVASAERVKDEVDYKPGNFVLLLSDSEKATSSLIPPPDLASMPPRERSIARAAIKEAAGFAVKAPDDVCGACGCTLACRRCEP